MTDAICPPNCPLCARDGQEEVEGFDDDYVAEEHDEDLETND